MNTVLFISWLCLPIAPLNPIEEDTLSANNIHFTLGVTTPNGIFSAGPEISSKYEMLIIHPLVARLSTELRYSKANSHLFPKGNLYGFSISSDILYYQGTDKLTAYLGAGVTYAFHHFNPFSSTSDSLLANEGITDITMSQQLGYRLTIGVRINKIYSLEVGISEVRPNFIKHWQKNDGSFTKIQQPTRTSGFRLSAGYLISFGKHR